MVLDEELKKQVMEVKRVCDRLMVVKVVIERYIWNIMAAYMHLKVGCSQDEFWEIMDETL